MKTPPGLRVFALAALYLLFVACQGGSPEATISREELLSRLADGSAPLLVDIRSPGDFVAAHLPGAINRPALAQGETALGGIQFGTELVVYGDSAITAREAAQQLQRRGYFEVRIYAEPFWQWREAGLPVAP